MRHLSGKILWVQTKAAREGEVLLSNFNISDVGTKPLSKKRLVVLTREVGMLYVESHEPVGELEREELRTYGSNTRNMSNLAKTILRQPLAGQEESRDHPWPTVVTRFGSEGFFFVFARFWFCSILVAEEIG